MFSCTVDILPGIYNPDSWLQNLFQELIIILVLITVYSTFSQSILFRVFNETRQPLSPHRVQVILWEKEEILLSNHQLHSPKELLISKISAMMKPWMSWIKAMAWFYLPLAKNGGLRKRLSGPRHLELFWYYQTGLGFLLLKINHFTEHQLHKRPHVTIWLWWIKTKTRPLYDHA